MGLTFHHLGDPDVRDSMLAHWLDEAADLKANWSIGACYGKQLTSAGWDVFLAVMPEALTEHDDEWLQSQLDVPEHWQPHLVRRGTIVNYDKADAIQKLAIGEFNTAYVRGLAAVLQDRGAENCLVYRADHAYVPRGECSSWEGQQFPVALVLAGHRARYHPPPGDRRAFSVPSGPNCHHSIRAL